MEGKSARSIMFPTKFTEVGGTFRVGSRTFQVVPKVIKLPCDACKGCSFGDLSENSKEPCPNQQCSPFDRRDGIGVWFVRID